MEVSPGVCRTPLYDRHVAAGGKMVDFAGWEMPLHYGSQIQEHMATRRAATIFDVSHMGEIFVVGPRALELVQAIVTRDVSAFGDGEEGYALLCNDAGGMLDDLFVARLGAREFLIVANAATYETDVAHMDALAFGLGYSRGDETRLEPASEQWSMIAVQGPRWIEVCRSVLGEGAWAGLPRNRIVRLVWHNTTLMLSTTGYTGEKGCELLCRPEFAGRLWDALAAGGARPAGLAARDSLRLEAGYLLCGQDFTNEINPFEARVGWAVQLNKPAFCGQAALVRIKESGLPRRLVGLLPEGKRIPRHGAKILCEGATVGEVTSGGYSPILERPIAMGYVARPHAEVGTALAIDLGRGAIRAEVVKTPFVKLG
jgi:aminomethyltransferase